MIMSHILTGIWVHTGIYSRDFCFSMYVKFNLKKKNHKQILKSNHGMHAEVSRGDMYSSLQLTLTISKNKRN